MVKDYIKKILTFIVFFKLIRSCESGDYVNFMVLCGSFLDAPLAHPLINTLIFWQEKGIEVVHILAKSHLCLICSSAVFKFQMFS